MWATCAKYWVSYEVEGLEKSVTVCLLMPMARCDEAESAVGRRPAVWPGECGCTAAQPEITSILSSWSAMLEHRLQLQWWRDPEGAAHELAGVRETGPVSLSARWIWWVRTGRVSGVLGVNMNIGVSSGWLLRLPGCCVFSGWGGGGSGGEGAPPNVRWQEGWPGRWGSRPDLRFFHGDGSTQVRADRGKDIQPLLVDAGSMLVDPRWGWATGGNRWICIGAFRSSGSLRRVRKT